jgi:uncharacterized protein (TIGR02268 family)
LTLPAGSCVFLVVLLLLSGSMAWAEAVLPSAREVKARRLELPLFPSGEVPEVRVALGYLTVLEFGAPLAREAVKVEGRENRFALLEINARTIVLRPAVEWAPTERLLLTVGFADGLAPARAVFALVAHPSEVDGQLQVVRRPLSNEALQARLEAVLARCETGGLAKVVLSGALDRDGVTVTQLTGVFIWNGLAGVPSFQPTAYRSWKLFVATVPLQLPTGEPTWVPGEARLLDAMGRMVRRMSVWMDVARLEPGESGVIAVEVERRSSDAGKRFSLEVRERGGGRGVLIQEVEF